MVLGGRDCAVPQNTLDHRIIHPQAVEIRRQTPAEPMPSMPGHSSTSEHIFHLPLIASVQIKRVSNRICEDRAARWIATSYTLGAAGNRTAVAELSGRGVSYGYDNDYHLLSETITSDPAGNNGSETYTYDAVGNRLTLNSTIPSLSGANTYVYDSNDRLSTDEPYDNDGKTTASVGITNTYDFENHMLKHGSVSMVYDGDGNRCE